ncbi:YcjX family protein, partial [Marinovum sp. 1_MG-2023]|uniref:YcjX family protein n=1 Tax=Marinovum sp. 1_MG-2023 TaxID=3062633 RepID=UPI0026E1619D
MMIHTLADGVSRSVEAVTDPVTSPMFEPVIRPGVTGPARSGKTVFNTSLLANLLDRGRMSGVVAPSE